MHVCVCTNMPWHCRSEQHAVASHQSHQMMTLLVLQQHHLHMCKAANKRRQDDRIDGVMPSRHRSPHAIHGNYLELLSALVHQHVHSLQEAGEVVIQQAPHCIENGAVPPQHAGAHMSTPAHPRVPQVRVELEELGTIASQLLHRRDLLQLIVVHYPRQAPCNLRRYIRNGALGAWKRFMAPLVRQVLRCCQSAKLATTQAVVMCRTQQAS
jgi:hypothetical protein